MCPSYMATRNEKDTTRARANILREFLTHSTKVNRFDHKEIYDVMDLCLSCKACKSECPSNVDMAKLKAEFLQQYYDVHGVPLRSKLIAWFTTTSKLGSLWPGVYNFFMTSKSMSPAIKKMVGFASNRSMPRLHNYTFKSWFKKAKKTSLNKNQAGRKIYLFCDEFTNYNDVRIGEKAVLLLQKLGYIVEIPKHLESGRTWMSKGLIRKAKEIANKNIELLSPLITAGTPLIGIEPSAILSFRDEYIDLATDENFDKAKSMSQHVFLIDEFLAKEAAAGHIDASLFTTDKQHIKLHGHCQQKSISSAQFSKDALSIPENYSVEIIPSGCCGMAGSFGYEAEHYDISMKIGSLVLFPAVTDAEESTLMAAPGTSCRHQIMDGTGKKALHPVEILYNALI